MKRQSEGLLDMAIKRLRHYWTDNKVIKRVFAIRFRLSEMVDFIPVLWKLQPGNCENEAS